MQSLALLRLWMQSLALLKKCSSPWSSSRSVTVLGPPEVVRPCDTVHVLLWVHTGDFLLVSYISQLLVFYEGHSGNDEHKL